MDGFAGHGAKPTSACERAKPGAGRRRRRRIADVERGLFSGSRALPIIDYDITVLDYHR